MTQIKCHLYCPYNRPPTGSATIATAERLAPPFLACAQAIADTGRELAALGWTPATSSNFSLRVGPERVAITISGRDKGRLSATDIMLVDLEGHAVGGSERPSAETLLHTQLYRRFSDVGAVLHTHSHAQTVASRLFAKAGFIRFAGYELLKAFPGYDTHEAVLDLPVLPNSQDMPTLARQIDARFDAGERWVGYLIDGHGIYTWGRDLFETRRHLDAFEFLLNCELDLRRLRA
jgi:methylthioribulose-1-phosphate dehydratase